MPPGAFISYCLGDKDELELTAKDYVQPHETDHTSQDMEFENSLCVQSFFRTNDKRNNTRKYNLEDTTINPCKKKSKLDDNHYDNEDDFLVNTVDNNNETRQGKQTVPGCTKTTTDSPHGLIKTNETPRAAAANSTTPEIRASGSVASLKRAPMMPLAESLDLQAKNNLSAKELAFVNYYKVPVDHVVTPTIPMEGFSSEYIKRQLNNRPQKYCIMMHYQGAIHLFHSAFMVDDFVFACESRTGIDGDTYTQFHISQFTEPMTSLQKWDIFKSTDDNNVFPSAVKLVEFKSPQDLLSFSEDNKLLDVPLEVAKKVPRPSAIMLVTGEVFYSMVALYGKSSYTPGEDQGYYFSIKEVLNYIRFATMTDNRIARFNPLVYFILAVHQHLNPAIPELTRVMMESHDSKLVATNYNQLRDRFAQYNTKLINDQKNQKSIDARNMSCTKQWEINPRLDKNPGSDRHKSVSDAESSQPQFPLRDGPLEEELTDSANLDALALVCIREQVRDGKCGPKRDLL